MRYPEWHRVIADNPRKQPRWLRVQRDPLSTSERLAFKQLHGKVREPEDVAKLLATRAELERVEVMWLVLLDSQAQIVGLVEMTRGTLNSSLVTPRDVFQLAIIEDAAGVIVVHNHPSGDPTPSAEDRAVSRALVAAGRIVDIPMLDFVVIGDNGRFVSFATLGLL